MQDSRIDELLDNVMMNAANVCGNLKTIKTSFDELKKEIEKLKVDLIHEREKNEKLAKEHAKLENDMRKYATDIISQSKTICNLKKELDESYKAWDTDSKNYQKRDMTLVDELSKKNEEIKKLKTEVTEALAKRDYWQNLANKEAADAKKVKWDCEKEMEWQKKKLQEFDHVLTKYRAKIKELEGHDEKSQLAILAGAYAIRKHFDGGAYYSIAANGIISWKHAEQILMDMVTKE